MSRDGNIETRLKSKRRGDGQTHIAGPEPTPSGKIPEIQAGPHSVMSGLTGAVIWAVALLAGLELETEWGVIASC